MSVKHVSFFSSMSDYQQSQNSNNSHFFIFCYPSTAFTITSAIKFIISLTLFTAVVSTIISNHVLFTFDSYVQSLLNKAEKQHYCDNNLCFYCDESDHWLSNCSWKHTIHINEITFQTPPSKQLTIEASSISINVFELQLKNEWSFWIITQKALNQH